MAIPNVWAVQQMDCYPEANVAQRIADQINPPVVQPALSW
jgi:hypothetical protein